MKKNDSKVPQHVRIGRFGESYSARYLWLHGWWILERNFRYSHKEIDIIARKGKTIVFVEVKTRKYSEYSRKFATAAMAVNEEKRRNVISAARSYLAMHKSNLRPRFDIIEVYISEDGKKIKVDSFNHIENAYAF